MKDMLVGAVPTLKKCTTSWYLFPPQTKEIQLDEKWNFVGKKEKTIKMGVAEEPLKGDKLGSHCD